MPACLECMLVQLIIRRWTWSQCRSAFIPLSDRPRFAAAILGRIIVAGGLLVVDRRAKSARLSNLERQSRDSNLASHERRVPFSVFDGFSSSQLLRHTVWCRATSGIYFSEQP